MVESAKIPWVYWVWFNFSERVSTKSPEFSDFSSPTIRRGYTEFVDALERAEEECRQCGIAAAMAAGTTLGQSALQAGGYGG